MVKHDVSRKELKEDAIRDSMFWMIQWAYNHRKWIISAVVVVLAGGGTALGFTLYRQNMVRDEAAAFHVAEQRIGATKDMQERFVEGRKAYQEFLKAHPDGILAPEALMMLGRVAHEDGKYEEAMGYLERVLNHASSSQELRNIARIGLSALAEIQGQLDKAGEYASGLPESQYAALKAYTLGRLALERKDIKEARRNFDEVAKALPPTILNDWARQMLDYLP